jgi:hypothetical protein
MIRSLRRVFVWGCQHGFTILAVFLVVGYSLSLLKPGPAQADEEVDLLKSVALSDLAMEDRLIALEHSRSFPDIQAGPSRCSKGGGLMCRVR